jgi:hypothetical protein
VLMVLCFCFSCIDSSIFPTFVLLLVVVSTPLFVIDVFLRFLEVVDLC